MLKNSKGVKYYTPKEVAGILGVSDRSVYAYINDNEIKAVQYRKREKLISEIELERFVSKYWGTIEE